MFKTPNVIIMSIPGIIPHDCKPNGVSRIPRQSIDFTTFAVVGNNPILGNISVFDSKADDPNIVLDSEAGISSSFSVPYCFTLS